MALADDIRDCRDRTLADLEASFDYYTHTKVAWRIIQQIVKQGHRISVRNLATGTMVDGQDLAGRAQKYVTENLAEATFQHFVSLFEDFVFGLLRLWLTTYPQGIPHKDKKHIDFLTILDAPDKDALIMTIINQELYNLSYKRPAEWFKYLNDRVDLACPTEAEIEILTEIKASRDILVHNRAVVNDTYMEKAARRARYALGQHLEIPEHYHRESWETIRKVVQDLAYAAIRKA